MGRISDLWQKIKGRFNKNKTLPEGKDMLQNLVQPEEKKEEMNGHEKFVKEMQDKANEFDPSTMSKEQAIMKILEEKGVSDKITRNPKASFELKMMIDEILEENGIQGITKDNIKNVKSILNSKLKIGEKGDLTYTKSILGQGFGNRANHQSKYSEKKQYIPKEEGIEITRMGTMIELDEEGRPVGDSRYGNEIKSNLTTETRQINENGIEMVNTIVEAERHIERGEAVNNKELDVKLNMEHNPEGFEKTTLSRCDVGLVKITKERQNPNSSLYGKQLVCSFLARVDGERMDKLNRSSYSNLINKVEKAVEEKGLDGRNEILKNSDPDLFNYYARNEEGSRAKARVNAGIMQNIKNSKYFGDGAWKIRSGLLKMAEEKGLVQEEQEIGNS